MPPNTITWEFNAHTQAELLKVRQSLPESASATVASELLQVVCLLETLAKSDAIAFPFRACHAGVNGVPDFQFLSGEKRIAVEMAKVTTQNVEHARSLQMRFPDSPLHYDVNDLCDPQTFARRLKAECDGWYRFIAGLLPDEVQSWLRAWDRNATVPLNIKVLLVDTLNAIIDGPSIESSPMLVDADPSPKLCRVQGFPHEETPRCRKSWLDDALWEEIGVTTNRTLMVGPLMSKDDLIMPRQTVLEPAFSLPILSTGSSTLEEERQVWLNKVCSEIQDKTGKVTGDSFCHGDEDWLVLWDRLGGPEWQLNERVTAVSQRLQNCWGPGWFSRVFLQGKNFDWQVMFTVNGVTLITPPE